MGNRTSGPDSFFKARGSTVSPLSRLSCGCHQCGGPEVPTANQAESGEPSNQGWLDVLLRNLDRDPARAADRYVLLWGRLEKFFERRQCIDAGALADNCITLLGRRLEKIHIDDVELYALGIARRIYWRYLHTLRGDRGTDDVELVGDQDPARSLQEQLDAERLRDCIQICVQGLSRSDRETLAIGSGEDAPGLVEARATTARRLSIDEGDLGTTSARDRLAQDLGITEDALKKRIHDARRKLRVRVSNCLKAAKRK
jgi:hypothetical protein